VWSLILAELFPEHREALLARGKEFGIDRTLAGMHYPTDVAAGQKLGAEIFRRLMTEPDFKAQLDHARAECKAAEMAHH
jgi:acid phosphatase (class A)